MSGTRDEWLAIEMRHLAALSAVACEASFSGAAERLGYVQSAISQQIAYLERVVGRRLVERSARPRSVALTPAGATLLGHVDQILEQLRLAKAEVDGVARRPRHAPSVGLASVFGAWLPATLLQAMLPEAGGPGWGRVECGTSARLLDAVAARRLDAAFVGLPIASGPFSAIELLDVPVVLAAPPRPALRSVGAVLGRWPLVDVRDCRATHALRRGPAGEGHVVDDPGVALALVRAGAAAAVVTRRDLLPSDEHLLVLEPPAAPPRVLGLAWHRDDDDGGALPALRRAARAAVGA